MLFSPTLPEQGPGCLRAGVLRGRGGVAKGAGGQRGQRSRGPKGTGVEGAKGAGGQGDRRPRGPGSHVAHATRGPDEVIAKSPIWLKLYQMNIWNPSRKDKKSFFQNMN